MIALKTNQVRAVLSKIGTGPAAAITAVTPGTPPTITAPAHGLLAGDAIVVADAEGLSGVNGLVVGVGVVDADTLTLTGATGTGTWTSGGTVRRVFSTMLPIDCENVCDTFNQRSDGRSPSPIQTLVRGA